MEKNKPEVDYRAERKARIAKNAAKGKKGKIDSYIVVKSILIAVCVVLVVAAAVGVCNAYGVPQRLLPAVTVGDRTYSVAEYEYYYTSLYGTQAQQSQSFADQYGGTSLLSALGQYDYTVHPEKASKTEGEETITWAEYFDNSVVEMMQAYDYYFAQCKELGIELDDTDEADIEDMLAEIQTYADMYSVSLTRYLGSMYGNGMTKKLYKSILSDQKLAEKYIAHIEEQQKSAVSDSAIEDAYNADPSAYQVVDLRVFGFAADGSSVTTENTTESADTEKTTDENAEDKLASIVKKAEEFRDRITDEQSFIDLAVEYAAESDKESFKNPSATIANQISKSVVSANISEDLAKWLFEDGRKTGDKYSVTSNDKDYVYVVYVVKPAYREDAPKVDVRHILVSYETGLNHMESHTKDGTEHTQAESDAFAADVAEAEKLFNLTVDYDFAAKQNEKYTKEVVAATYSATYDIYEEYLKNATEENFAKLATSYSADTSSTTNHTNTENGGLYEDVAKNSMVDNFDKWIYDSSRKNGDVGIVQTEYGFHIIYFVGKNARADWQETVIESLTAETQEEFNAKLEEIVADKTNVNVSSFKNFAYNQSMDLIEKIYGASFVE